jgi:hypothetical protein
VARVCRPVVWGRWRWPDLIGYLRSRRHLDKVWRGPPSDSRPGTSTRVPLLPELRGGPGERTHHSSAPLALSPRPQRQAAGERAKRAAAEQWQVSARIPCFPAAVSRFSARSADSFVFLRISRGSGSPDSGARRSGSRSRTGAPTAKPTGPPRRGPPIWRSTSSSSSRCVLPPAAFVAILSDVPNACGCCSLVLVR